MHNGKTVFGGEMSTDMETPEGRETWGSKIGFILTAAGFSIGLGNIWRFPFVTGKYGGGAFVLLYLFFLVVIAIPLFGG